MAGSCDTLMDLGLRQPKEELILDLPKGFSAKLKLLVENNGDRTVAFNTPLFVLPADAGKDDDPVVDLARTFGEGLLESADESGRTVRIDYLPDSYCSDLENFIWSPHPYHSEIRN
jgi:hypothetical protein